MTVLCWLDLETTGLDPTTDHILQASIRLTNTDLILLAAPYDVTIFHEPVTLSLMKPSVRAMHTETGLLRRVQESKVSPADAFASMTAYVRDNSNSRESEEIILAGSSVHFDRRFIEQWVPTLYDMLHYRQLDVSAFKLCASWWGYPPFEPRGVRHLAPNDIENSILELQFYRRHMLR